MIEIARSFSQTIQLKPFEPISFFCSAKEECEPQDMEAVSKRLVHFCKQMIKADIHNYLKEHPEIQYKEVVIDANTLQPMSVEDSNKYDEIADKTGYY